MEMQLVETQVPARSIRGLSTLVDFFDSIRLGIILIILIFAYSALGSAVPVFRQQFELTEFQYFNHWVFVVLIALFCTCLVVTTVRRIPLNLRNLGVLTVHTGLLVLCAGSVVYFGRKIEGDVWLDSPRVRLVSVERLKKDPSGAMLASFVAVPGKVFETNMPMVGGKCRIEITDVQHHGMSTAEKVTARVLIGSDEPKSIELSQRPSDSADAEQQRIVKINERLALWLVPANVAEYFYDESTPVLLVENGGHVERFELPTLPYYTERFLPDVETVKDLNGTAVASAGCSPLRPFEKWAMPIALGDPSRAIDSDWPIRLQIDGYLPYARLTNEPVEGGSHDMPIARVRLESAGKSNEDWLVARMPEQSMLEFEAGPAVEFTWLDDAETMVPETTKPLQGSHVLTVRVKDKNVEHTYDVKEGMEIAVNGTDYKLKIEELRPSWPLMTAGFQNARTPIALVWVDSPKQKFQRSVLDRYPQLNQDRDRAGKKISPTANLVDENIELRYVDASRHRFLIAASTRLAPTLIHTAPGGARKMQRLEKNSPVSTSDGTQLTLTNYILRPDFKTVAQVVPERSRRSLGTVRRTESLVRVHLKSKSSDWSKHIWVPFSQYNTEHDGTTPTVVSDVPGLGTLRMVYGRATRPLPARMTLEHLQTDFYPGRQQPREWTSHFRYEDPGTRSPARARAFLNNTASIGGWTFFQSQASADHEAWTVLGVGNRQGVLSMLLGCILISLGMVYAFTVKPLLVRRRRRQIHDSRDIEHPEPSSVLTAVARTIAIAAVALGGASLAKADSTPDDPAASLQKIEKKIDLPRLSALALQHSWRYATVDSWARDAVKTIHGKTNLFGLEAVTAAVEIMFNGDAYRSEPIIFIKDNGFRIDLTAHPVQIDEVERRRILRTGLVSYEFLSNPVVMERLRELSGDMLKKSAMDRLQGALGSYLQLGETFTIVPNPRGRGDTPWTSLLSETPAAPMATPDEPGLNPSEAAKIRELKEQFRIAWINRDADGINRSIAALEEYLPTLAPRGVYPGAADRAKEVTYRRLGLMRWAWIVYIFAFFVSIFAVATGYRWVRAFGLLLLGAALGLHGWDIALRWNVIGRIPVANMYEAVTSSTWIGAFFGLLLELFLRKRVFLLGSALLGFFALALPELLPQAVDNRLSTMMPILDDIMLRIHTVLIISSYAVITVAYGVANCYLFVAGFRRGVKLALGAIGAQLGAVVCLLFAWKGYLVTWSPAWFISAFTGFTAAGAILLLAAGRLIPARNAAASEGLRAADFPVARDMLEEFDLSHRVLLYTATIALFVGLVLGAVWADYSWGRPWGWDPKEVFALCTWLIYAILIHVKYITRRGPLWTSVLSVIGFAVMQFNWWVVNFYIVGLHSYA